MVNYRNPPTETSDETVEPAAGQALNDIIEEIIQDVIPDEDDEDLDEYNDIIEELHINNDADDLNLEITHESDVEYDASSPYGDVNIEVTHAADAEHDGSLSYDELWDEVMNTVHNYAGVLDASVPVHEPMRDRSNQAAEVGVHYGPLESVSYTTGPAGNGQNLLTIYLLPNVHNFNAHNLSHTPHNTHYIQLTPNEYSNHFYTNDYTIELSPSSSDMFELPVNTHTIHLSSLSSSVTCTSSSSSVNLRVTNNDGINSNIIGVSHVPNSQNVLLRASSHTMFGSRVTMTSRSADSLSVQTLSHRTPRPVHAVSSSTSVCRCHGVPATTDRGPSFPSVSWGDVPQVRYMPSSSSVSSCSYCRSQQMLGNSNDYSDDATHPSQYSSARSSSTTISPRPTPRSTSSGSTLIESSVSNQSSQASVINNSCPRRNAQDNRSIISCSSASVGKGRDNYQGRKRRRRNANSHFLFGGGNIEEQDEVPELRGSTRFGILFNDTESLQVWTNFMQSSEEVQKELLRRTPKKSSLKRKDRRSTVKENREEEESVQELSQPSNWNAFSNLSQNQRDLFASANLPYGMVVYLEELIVEHFGATPRERLVSPPISSFERLILHAIAAYYSLTSETIEDERGRRVTVVTNTSEVFQPPQMRLLHYIDRLEERRQNRFGSSPTK